MERFAIAAAKLMPRLDRLAARTDAQLERTAADTTLTTGQAIDRMLELTERKRAIVGLAALYERMVGVLRPRERSVFEQRARGGTEEAIAASLGISRATVVRTYETALKKCKWFLHAAEAVGMCPRLSGIVGGEGRRTSVCTCASSTRNIRHLFSDKAHFRAAMGSPYGGC